MKNLILLTILASLLALTSCGNRIDKIQEEFEKGGGANSNYDKSMSYYGNMNEVLSNTLNECTNVSILKNTTNANINFSNNSFQYEPNQNYVGIDEVIVDCYNKKYLLIFNIKYKNHDPSSNNITINLNEDEIKNFQISFSDIDNNVNNINFRTPPTNGNITGSFNSYTYTPNLNFSGTDFTEFQIVDSGGGYSPWYQITFNVNSIDDTPSTNDKSYTFIEDSSDNQIVLDGTDPDSMNLTFGTTLPSNGTLTCNNDNCLYTPNLNFHGSDSFDYTVSDGNTTSTSTISITVTPVNDSPVSNNVNISTNEDNPVNIILQGSDVDSVISYSTTNPSNGTLSCNNEDCTYTPSSNFNGSDSFNYTVSDGSQSSTSVVNITVVPVQDLPVAMSQNLNLDEDTSINFTLQATDGDNDSLSYIVVTQPTNGTLNCSNGNCLYTPNTDFNGNDLMSFKVNDGSGDSNTANVNFTINPINDSPVVNDLDIDVERNSTNNSITLSANDVDGNSLTYSVVSQPTNGTLNCSNQACEYTPYNNYVGTDSFTYRVNDRNIDSNIATVSIDVLIDNTAPISQNQSLTFLEDSVDNSITLVSNDSEGDSLTYSIVSQSTNGTLNCSNGNCLYTPNTDFNGNDIFTFKSNDGEFDSNISTVNITVTPQQDNPIANNLNLVTQEDTLLNFQLSGSDADNDPLTYSVVSQPINGTLNCTNNTCDYTPNQDFNGSDSFTYKVNDGNNDSNIATIPITVNPENDSPTVASNFSLSVDEDSTLDISISMVSNSNDVDGDALTYEITSSPSNGIISGTHPNLIYTPNQNYNGADSFTYRVFDGNSYSSNSTVNITVNPINDNPISNNLSYTLEEDTVKSITLDCSDIDGDSLAYTTSNPSHGTIACSSSSCSYTPDLNYNGVDSFTYYCNDYTVNSNNSTVSLTIIADNDTPVANSNTQSTDEDTVLNFALTASDVENDTLNYTIESTTTNGVLNCSQNNCIYTPNQNFNGSDSLTFKVNDGNSDSNIATVSIVVNAVNDAPVSNNMTVSTDINQSVNFTLNASDIEGDSLSPVIVSNVDHGTLSCTDLDCTYTPNSLYFGSDFFSYKVSDGNLESTISNVQIEVVLVNVSPIANDDTVNTTEDNPVSFELTCSDVDLNIWTYTVLNTTNNGSLNCTNEFCTYSPNPNFNGTDSLTYRCNDGFADSNTATVTINVQSVNDLPTSSNQTFAIEENESLNFNITAQDLDGDTISYIQDSSVSNGTLTGSFPNFTYKPNLGFSGSDFFTYHLNDGTGNSPTYTITFNINELQGNGLNAHYFDYYSNGLSYVGSNVIPTVDFNWGSSEPYSGLTPDSFSVRYEGFVRPKHNETYTFYTNSDDGVRLWINGQLIIDEWSTYSLTEHSGTISLNEQEFYHIVLEYYEQSGDNEVHLSWSSASQSKEIIPQDRLFSGKMIKSSFRDNYTQLVINRTRTNTSSDYPVLIDLTNIPSGEDFWNNVQTDGEDMVITVNSLTNRVPLEIASFDKVNKKGQVWIKSDLFQENVNNIFIHYNDSTTSDVTNDLDSTTYGTYNVWSNGYVLVTHMEQPNGFLFDSSHGDLIVDYGNPLYNQTSASNSLGGAVGLNISQTSLDYFNLNTSQTTRFNMTDQFTLQSWLKIYDKKGNALVIKKQGSYHHHGAYSMIMDKYRTKARVQSIFSCDKDSSNSDINENEWTLVSTTYNNSANEFRFYTNNLTNGTTYTSAEPSSTNGTIEIGGTNERSDHFLSGYLDEVRISNKVRDFNWIKNDYDSMKNNNLWFFYLEYQE